MLHALPYDRQTTIVKWCVLQFYLQRGLVQFWLIILQGKVEAVPHVVGVDVGPQVGPALVPQSLGQIVLFGSPQQTAALVKTLDIHLVGVDIPVRLSGGERETNCWKGLSPLRLLCLLEHSLTRTGTRRPPATFRARKWARHHLGGCLAGRRCARKRRSP